jgi:molybdopterin molybdotransferase
LRTLAGLPGAGRVVIQARLDVRQAKPPGLAVYLRSRVILRGGEPWVIPLRSQLSGDLTSSADLGALALLPAGRGRLARGTRVAAILLGPMAG